MSEHIAGEHLPFVRPLANPGDPTAVPLSDDLSGLVEHLFVIQGGHL